jgi:hypothetical protein
LVKKEKPVSIIPRKSTGIKSLPWDIPEARRALISLSEESLPMAIRAPRREENGKVNARIAGSE